MARDNEHPACAPHGAVPPHIHGRSSQSLRVVSQPVACGDFFDQSQQGPIDQGRRRRHHDKKKKPGRQQHQPAHVAIVILGRHFPDHRLTDFLHASIRIASGHELKHRRHRYLSRATRPLPSRASLPQTRSPPDRTQHHHHHVFARRRRQRPRHRDEEQASPAPSELREPDVAAKSEATATPPQRADLCQPRCAAPDARGQGRQGREAAR